MLRFSCSIYCWAGLYEAAIGYGQQAIEHQSGEASAFLWLGHSFFLAGSLTAARDNYIRAIELAPDSYFYRFTISQIPKLMRSRSIADENVQGIIQLFQQAIADLDRARTE